MKYFEGGLRLAVERQSNDGRIVFVTNALQCVRLPFDCNSTALYDYSTTM